MNLELLKNKSKEYLIFTLLLVFISILIHGILHIATLNINTPPRDRQLYKFDRKVNKYHRRKIKLSIAT